VGGGLSRSVGGWVALQEYRDAGIRIKADERILGSSDFVDSVLKKADEQLEEKYRLQALGIGLETLIDRVAHHCNIDPENLKSTSKERTITEARRILCFLAVRKLGHTCSDVARALGISPVTVSKAVASGSTLAEMGKIQKRILGS
jgi:chromosomal replication initiation ATPase DnaA